MGNFFKQSSLIGPTKFYLRKMRRMGIPIKRTASGSGARVQNLLEGGDWTKHRGVESVDIPRGTSLPTILHEFGHVETVKRRMPKGVGENMAAVIRERYANKAARQRIADFSSTPRQDDATFVRGSIAAFRTYKKANPMGEAVDRVLAQIQRASGVQGRVPDTETAATLARFKNMRKRIPALKKEFKNIHFEYQRDLKALV